MPSESSIVFDYDSLGRQKSVTRGTQLVTSSYDTLGRLQSTSTNGKTLSYGYDSAGRRNSLTYPDGFVVHYQYESDNSLRSILENNNAVPLVEYSYNQQSRLNGIFRRNNITSVLEYTPLHQLQNFDHATVNKASFQYNPAGQLISRLTSSADYQIKIPQPGRQDYLPNNLNQYSTVGGQSLSYDLNGNLKSFDGWLYSYNAHNRLTSANKGDTSLSLEYDATGRLHSSTVYGTKTTFLYDGNELVAEYNAAGTLLKRYVHGVGSDDPLVSYDGAGTTNPTYLLADERGSIVAETNASGTVTTKHQYGPYGEPINQSASRFRYTGQILLPGTELYHYKARVYHPKLGRFLQTDPIGYKDGMNWYAYVGNDPMNAVDPDGESLKLLKAAFNVAKRMLKGDSGKDAIKGELTDIADNVLTLTDGKLGLDDAIAVVDLATGFGKEAGKLVDAARGPIQHTTHSLNQKINRQVKSADELDAVRNPLKKTDVKYDSQGRPSEKFIGEKATVAINPETGKVVTVHPTGSKLAERLIRQQGGEQ